MWHNSRCSLLNSALQHKLGIFISPAQSVLINSPQKSRGSFLISESGEKIIAFVESVFADQNLSQLVEITHSSTLQESK